MSDKKPADRTFIFLGCFRFTAAEGARGTFNILATAPDQKAAMSHFDTELNRQFDVPGGLLHQLKDVDVYTDLVAQVMEGHLPDSIMLNFSIHQFPEGLTFETAFVPQMGSFKMSMWMPIVSDGKGGETNLFWRSNPEKDLAVTSSVEQATFENVQPEQEKKG